MLYQANPSFTILSYATAHKKAIVNYGLLNN